MRRRSSRNSRSTKSQQKAADAAANGRLKDEIVPIETPDHGVVDQDGTILLRSETATVQDVAELLTALLEG